MLSIVPGKWLRIDCPQVPRHFFEHFLYRVDTQINSIQMRAHRSFPYNAKTRKLSYKFFDVEKLSQVLEEQTLVKLKHSMSFTGDSACEDDQHEKELSPEEYVLMATRRAAIPIQFRKRVTSKATIVLGVGEGRATREVELIWWPEIFTMTNYGHLVLRLFISKCNV